MFKKRGPSGGRVKKATSLLGQVLLPVVVVMVVVMMMIMMMMMTPMMTTTMTVTRSPRLRIPTTMLQTWTWALAMR